MKLRSCPFCRSRHLTIHDLQGSGFVFCNNCGASGPSPLQFSTQSKKVSADRWNTRAIILDELPDGVKKLIPPSPPKAKPPVQGGSIGNLDELQAHLQAAFNSPAPAGPFKGGLTNKQIANLLEQGLDPEA